MHTLHPSPNSGLTGDDWTVEKRPVGSEVEGKGSGRRQGLGERFRWLWLLKQTFMPILKHASVFQK